MDKPAVSLTLIKQAIQAKMANQRQATSSTKTRGQVSGGGKKPWKQKGTGRARSGSNRSPIWIGGGITFGPNKNEQYKVKLPKAMAKNAFNQLLNLMKQNGQITQFTSLKLAEAKTKLALETLKKNNLPTENSLIVTANLEPELILATNNLHKVKIIHGPTLSILDLASFPSVAMEQPIFYHYFPAEKPKPATKVIKRK